MFGFTMIIRREVVDPMILANRKNESARIMHNISNPSSLKFVATKVHTE